VFLHNYHVFQHASVMKPMHITSSVLILCVVMLYLAEVCNVTSKNMLKTYVRVRRVECALLIHTPT